MHHEPSAAGTLDEILTGVVARVARAQDQEVRAVHRVPARCARYACETPPLHERLLAALQARGEWPLWSHQAQAVSETLAGRHVVVASSTASGKTHCYNLPVLDALLADPGASALYLFPTKALCQDQMRTLLSWYHALGIEPESGVYDGDTEPELRRRLRRAGRVVSSNPDMLHAAILPHHGSWAQFFRSLRYVVVDELHSLRGIFGSHVGNVLRRLRRLARHHGSDPLFIAASATIANPGEHAQRLVGLPFTVVDDDGAPHGEKSYVLWNPPLFERDDGTSYRKGAPSVAVRLLPELVRRGVKTICFGRSRNTVELILRYVRERNRRRRGYEDVADRLEAYRGGYLPSERRAIENRLFSGELGGVVATNALELGIDIGALDACILAGWPGSVCSFLQQAGRAGRRHASSVVFLVAGQEPIDQYFMRHPEALLGASPEHASAEWQNPYILVRHLICAAYELPLGSADLDLYGPDLPGLLQLLEEEGQLRELDGRWYGREHEYPAAGVKLRTATDENFTILELDRNEVVGELDYVAAMLSLYEGAVYLHRTETFLVEEMDAVNQVVKIRRTETGYYTQALCHKQVQVQDEWESRADHGARLLLGEVEVVTHITGYKKVRFHTIENIGYGKIELPPLELDTVALGIELADEVVRAADPYGPDFLRAGCHGLMRVLQHMLAIRAFCDVADLDTFVDGQRMFVYDLYPGGIGHAEVGYENYRVVMETCLEAVAQCPCGAGCPACVLPAAGRVETALDPTVAEYPYPKEATRFLLHCLLGLAPYAPHLVPRVLLPPPPPPRAPPALDARTSRKARMALRHLRGTTP